MSRVEYKNRNRYLKFVTKEAEEDLQKGIKTAQEDTLDEYQ